MRGALDADATMTVRVEGIDVETGDAREVTGTVEKARHVAHSSGEDIDPELAGEVMLLVDTGEETVSVGGWDAVVEDIEATRIVVEAIDRPDAVQMRTED
jgi:hypothetical protein